MRVSALKKDSPLYVSNDKYIYGVQTYGINNSFPQDVKLIVANSVTGGECVDIYGRFISGQGFLNEATAKLQINKRQTMNELLKECSKDVAMFGGIGLHFNYNANYKITSINIIPFEHIRFKALDDNNKFDKVCIHWDWARQFRALRQWKKEDIVEIDLFNPDPVVIQEQVDNAGGWQNYKGQVYYFSNNGYKTYPMPIYQAALTDMNTEEGLMVIDNRNARNRFMIGGAFIEINNENNNTESDEEFESKETDTEKVLFDMQGDEESCKIIYMQVPNAESVPKFIPFESKNYAEDYDITNKNVSDRIGRSFMQPPILRAENVGANFGADLMMNAYKYYNNITTEERMTISRIFTEIFKYWKDENIVNDFSINPLAW